MSRFLIAEVTNSLDLPSELKTLIVEYSDSSLIRDLAYILKLYFSKVFKGFLSKFIDFEGITAESLNTIDRAVIALRSDPMIKNYFKNNSIINIIKCCIKSFNEYEQYANKIISRINTTLFDFGIVVFGSLFNDIRCIFDNTTIPASDEFYFRLALVCYIFDDSNSITYYFNKIHDIRNS